jgi:hypothetical protein
MNLRGSARAGQLQKLVSFPPAASSLRSQRMLCTYASMDNAAVRTAFDIGTVPIFRNFLLTAR